MSIIPEFLFAGEFDLPDAATDAFDRVATPWPDGMRVFVPTAEVEPGDTAVRHRDENPAKCAKREAAARQVELWNVSDADYPVTLTEFNWMVDGSWRRAYGRVEDGYHRIEYARDNGVEAIWVQISEHRFAPPGRRPPDRIALDQADDA